MVSAVLNQSSVSKQSVLTPTPSFHSMMYTPEGKQTTERLWEETLEDLDFAGVRSIANSLRS